MKNTFDQLNTRLDAMKKKKSVNMKLGQQKLSILKKGEKEELWGVQQERDSELNIQEMWNNIKWPNIRVINVLERKRETGEID